MHRGPKKQTFFARSGPFSVKGGGGGSFKHPPKPPAYGPNKPHLHFTRRICMNIIKEHPQPCTPDSAPELCVRRSPFIIFSINLVYLKPFSPAENATVYITNVHVTRGYSILGGEHENVIATTHLQRWVPVSSNHLETSSVWKSLVASCVCVAKVWTRVVKAFISSTKAFVTSTKHVWPPRQKCSSPAQSTRSSSNWKVVWKTPEKEQKLGKKVSVKLHFSYGWAWKKNRHKAEIKERKKTILPVHLLCIFADIG